MAELFSIDPSPTFTVPVTLSAPGGVGRTLDITYRHKPRSAFRTWLQDVRAAPEEAVPDILLGIVAGWSIPEPLARESLVRLLDHHYLAKDEILLAYVEGLHEAHAKN